MSKKPNTKHGYYYHPLYKVWGGMKYRCYNRNHVHFIDYGGRGITVCDEWKYSPKIFIEWCLRNGWEKGLTIDRIDNDKGYYPSNCRFSSMTEQNRNRRKMKNNSSGITGVCFTGRGKKPYQVTLSGKYIGSFATTEEAIVARKNAEVVLWEK